MFVGPAALCVYNARQRLRLRLAGGYFAGLHKKGQPRLGDRPS